MKPSFISPSVLRALSIAGLVLATASTNANAQTTNWQSVASACTPASPSTLSLTQTNAPGGSVRAPFGPNPPLLYTCNVLDSFATIVPAWTTLELQSFDPVGGAVRATLFRKDKVTGAPMALATAVSVAAGGISNVSVAVPALNFATHSHHIVITMLPQVGVQVQAHMVRLDE
jgi:hypothetical protein